MLLTVPQNDHNSICHLTAPEKEGGGGGGGGYFFALYVPLANFRQWPKRSFVSFLLLQLSNSFLRILAVPNKAVFCNSPVLMVTPTPVASQAMHPIFCLLL